MDGGMSAPLVAEQSSGKNWTIYHGDCIDVARGLPDNSLHYVIYSPPFESLFTFSDDPRDLSNCRDGETFWTHYRFLIAEIYRAVMPGRLVSVHCMQLPTSKTRDGFIGLRDFRGEIIRAHCGNDAAEIYEAMRRVRARAAEAGRLGDATRSAELSLAADRIEQELREHPGQGGFIFHSEVMIRKDPVAAMQRSKSIGLLHKQVCKDSALSRMAVADYVVTMRKPGDNAEPLAGPFTEYHGTDPAMPAEDPGHAADHVAGSYSVKVWQRYAESVWLDINQSDVLSHRAARAEEDERHIAPLQLTVIRRCLQLWSNPGDVVFSPFAGIGSELYCAVQMGRRGLGAELKASYFAQAVHNLGEAENSIGKRDLFSTGEEAA